MVVAFPDGKKIIGRSPAILVDCSMVNNAPTNLILYVSSDSILFEIVARYCRTCAGKKIEINITHPGLTSRISRSVL